MSGALETQGVTLAIETGSGSAVTTVTATAGYPTIITKASHGLDNGDVVTLSAFAGTDAAYMNGKTAVVMFAGTNTLALDIDTTGKVLTAANGTLTPVTFSDIGELVTFDGPGSGTASIIDITHLKSTRKEKRIGLPDEGKMSLTLNLVPSDVGQLAAKASRDARTLKSYRVTLTDTPASVLTFSAYCLSFPISGGVDAKIAVKIDLEITGEVTWS